VTALAVGVIAWTTVASAARSEPATAATHVTTRCATFDVRGASNGVYVAKGHVACAVAKMILRAVASGKGKYVNNGFSYNSYTVYDGWLCPSGQMGVQTCEQSIKPVAHPSRQIFSLECVPAGRPGCPKRWVGETP
jgi:hypothetical protein